MLFHDAPCLVQLEQHDNVGGDDTDKREHRSLLHQVEATAVERELSAAFQLVQVELVCILSTGDVAETFWEL